MQNNNNNLLYRVLAVFAVYLGINYFGGDIGRMILYPIRLLVTFLHEFGHAFGALITGGEVMNLQVNSDGSGYTTTRGGSRAIILMGGYLGSAIFGNLLFYIGVRKPQWSKIVIYILSAVMIISAVFWFNSLFTTGLLLLFAIVLSLLASKTSFHAEILMFLGLATVLYIIQDFNIGPRSDLEKYAELFIFPSANVWMYIWLVIAVVVFIFNIRMIFRKQRSL